MCHLSADRAKVSASSTLAVRVPLKAKGLEMQHCEDEMMRHEKDNNTALFAIGGPKHKRLRLDDLPGAPDFTAAHSVTTGKGKSMGVAV